MRYRRQARARTRQTKPGRRQHAHADENGIAWWIAAARWSVKRVRGVVNLDGASMRWSVHRYDRSGERRFVHNSPTPPSRASHTPSTGSPCRDATVCPHPTSAISRSYVVNFVARTLLNGSACPVARWVARRKASNPSYERRAGVQAGNLVRVGNLVPGKPILAPAIRRGPVATGSLQQRSRAEGTRRRAHGARRENPEEAKPMRGADRPEP